MYTKLMQLAIMPTIVAIVSESTMDLDGGLSLEPSEIPLSRIRVRGYPLTTIRVNGPPLRREKGYFSSVKDSLRWGGSPKLVDAGFVVREGNWIPIT